MTESEKFMGILDTTALHNLREKVGGDDEFVAELIHDFLNDAPRMLADIHRGLQNGDAVGLGRAAHSLKSNCAEFGATDLHDLCQALEEIGRTNVLDGAGEKIAQADAEYEKVKVALEKVCEQQFSGA